MTNDQPRRPARHRFWLCLLGLALAGCNTSSPTAPTTTAGTTGSSEDLLVSVRETLRRGTDLNGCKGAVQQLNEHLNRHPDDRPPALSAAERELLTNRFGVETDELAEVENPAFTLLDAHYLEQCTFLRDIARGLQVEELPPAERAAAAFRWVVREVRLRERAGTVLPVGSVLRRGSGSALERASVLVDLLEQLGVPGCLVTVTAGEQEQGPPMLWCAGAVVDKDVLLFDPRLGLPVPGPDGKGVATLAQVRAKPELVQALNVDDKLRYDITPARAKRAEIYLATPLSALAPRQRWLQARLALPGRLALGVDVVPLVERLEALLKAAGASTATVKAWNPVSETDTPVRALRTSLPPSEGGTDKTHQRQLWRLELVPWQLMPPRLAALEGEPGARLKEFFGSPFLLLVLDPKMPRELMLRGRYDEAVVKLVQLRADFRRQREQLAGQSQLEARVNAWCEQATQLYGNVARLQQEAAHNPSAQPALGAAKKQIEALWKQSQAVQLYVVASAADSLLNEISYLLALCKHEQAERAQVALERLKAGKSDAGREAKLAQEAWRSAAEWWDTCLEEAPASPLAPAARLQRAHVAAVLGQPDAAVALLQNLNGEMTDLEKLARLYLARQLKPK